MAGAWDRALASDRPVVIEAVTDPDVLPLPPIVKPAVKGMVDRLVPHGG